MKVKVTRFAGVEGCKKRTRPAEGDVSVCSVGLTIERRPTPRNTWIGHNAENPLAWQERQIARVYLDEEQRAELAAELLGSIDPERARECIECFQTANPPPGRSPGPNRGTAGRNSAPK